MASSIAAPLSSPQQPLTPSAPPFSTPTPPFSTPTPPPTSSVETPLSPAKSVRSPHHMRSPNSHRRMKAAFPREEIWSWQGDSGSENGQLSPIQSPPDAIEAVLRESALTSLLTTPMAINSSLNSERRVPLSPVHRHSQSHGHHPNLHAHHHPPTPLSSGSSSNWSVPSTPATGGGAMASQQHLSIGNSRRKLHKKEGTQTALRGSARNLVSPAGSSNGREAEGWKAYKIAHRTNRLMAKTRKVLEVLHRTTGSGRKIKINANGTDEEIVEGDDDGSAAGAVHVEQEVEDEEEGERRELGRIRAERLALQQRFERDVCEDDDEVDSIRVEGPSQVDTSNNASPTESPEDFWQIYKSVGMSKRPGSARGRYIGKCEEKSLLVLPVLDLKKRASRYNPQTKTLRYDNYYFGDDRAEAFGDALHLLPVPVNNLSMKNVGITSAGSSAIVNGLSLRQLQHLNFSENRIGPKGAMSIFKGLRDPQVNLKTLDLGNNQLGDQAVIVLMQCLVNRCTLDHLDLRRNNIYHAAKAVGELLRITTPLRSLNLAWNNIRGEPAQCLAKCMMENITLTSLDLSDNTMGNNGNADAELGACLATNKSLKWLDVSNNHIHGKSVLVYVNGLQQNGTLETLLIRGNPIGNLGTEAILRSVASGAIAKCEIDIGDCNVEIQDASQQTVIYGGGMYSLNLSERAEAILLKELLLLSWKSKAEISDATWNGAPYTFNRKDEKAFVNTIPASGVMQVKVQPNYDRHEEMISHSGLVRIERLLQRSFGSGRDGDEAAKLLCIRLLAEEYSFTVDHANTLLALFQTHTSQVEEASAAAVLIPQISGTKTGSSSPSTREELYDCASMETPEEFFEDKDKDGKIDVCGDICMVIGLKNLSDVEQAHVEKRVGKWISFNVANPTGHYRLNMSNPIDRRILMRILETNRVEKKLRLHYKLTDTSQHGLVQQPLQGGFRNMRLNHVAVVMGTGWQFPRLGIFEFDFVQTKRPYSICTALNDAAFEKFLREFKQLDVNAETKLIGLRSISTSYYFNCGQVQRLMEHFGTFERDPETGILFRAEVFVILFSRIIDEWNFGETLSLLDLATKQQVLDRLGHLHCFHPLQVAETYGPLQLIMFDHRQLVMVLVKLAASGETELTNVVLNNETVVTPEEWKTWVSDDKLPAAGTLSCSLRASQGMQTESQLPPTSMRKKLIQTLLLKLENRSQEHIA